MGMGAHLRRTGFVGDFVVRDLGRLQVPDGTPVLWQTCHRGIAFVRDFGAALAGMGGDDASLEETMLCTAADVENFEKGTGGIFRGRGARWQAVYEGGSSWRW